jgi:integrase
MKKEELKNETKRVQRHLYRVAYRMMSGEWSKYHHAIFRDWKGIGRKFRISADLQIARKQLTELETKNFQKYDWDNEKTALAAQQKADAEKADVMTVAKWSVLCKDLPEVKQKRSLNRDGQLYMHVIRHLGDKPLTELAREDLFTYIEKRRGEKVQRYGKPSKTSVKDGTIKNELASLRRMLNLAASRGLKVAALSFKDALPSASSRSRVLSESEKKRLLPACEPWLRRLLITAMETSVSRGDLLRLTWSMVDEEEGVIVPTNGRKKTGVRQAAPLTDNVRAVLAEIRSEKPKMTSKASSKVVEISPLVFLREDGQPITGNMIVTALRNACKLATVSNFTFHDTRHTAKTNWARRGIPVEAAMLAAGHASVQMHQAYIHLQKSDVAKAFGTGEKFTRGLPMDQKAVNSDDAKN